MDNGSDPGLWAHGLGSRPGPGPCVESADDTSDRSVACAVNWQAASGSSRIEGER